MTTASDTYQEALRHHQEGNLTAAESLYRAMLRDAPEEVNALYLLGTLHSQRGEFAEAVRHLRHAAALRPEHPETHNNLGVTLREQGQAQAAVASYERALALKPDYPEAYFNFGNALRDQGHFDKAIASYEHAVELKPDYAKALNNLGTTLQEQGQVEAAVASFEHVLTLAPDYAEAHYNLGNALRDQGHFDKASASYRRAIAFKPDFVEAYNNLGTTLCDLRQCEAAAAMLEKALTLAPAHPGVQFSKATLWLSQGDLAQGWPAYEWRIHTGKQSQRDFSFPQWDGSSLRGRTILVSAEQGIGDEILFASCLPDVVAQASHCVVECDPRLVSLYTRSFPTATVQGGYAGEESTWLPQAPHIDVQSPIGSLPRHLRPTLSSFPPHTGYLVPDPQRLTTWRQRLTTLGSGLKVGIAWRSRAARCEHAFYTRLADWGPILTTPGVHFINLQYDDCTSELTAAQQQLGVTIQHWEDLDAYNDFDAMAALIASLDLVIAPEATVAALAGSIGKQVWQLSFFGGSWPMLGTGAHPWFPSMRVFCQTQCGNWPDTLTQVAQELGRLTPSDALQSPAVSG